MYGDPAYGLAGNIIGSFRGAHIADDEQAFNREMSKVRTCVEWGFGKICLDFAYISVLLLQPVGKYYFVAGILIYCYTCLNGSQTSKFLLGYMW